MTPSRIRLVLLGWLAALLAGSTLLVAALFVPVRHRVQAPLDRRFDRAHVDAAKVVQALRSTP